MIVSRFRASSLGFIASLLAPAALPAAAPRPVAQPNILFILADDLAFNDLGCYAYPGNPTPAGNPAPTPYPEKSAVAAPNQAVATLNGRIVSLTPNLDQLAAQGLKFANYHSPSSVCSPSRIGLMTGRTPARFGLGGIIAASNPAGLPTREITLPEALKSCGYATAAFGKWHLGNGEQHDPTNHGFDLYRPATGQRATELERLTSEALEFIQANRSGPFFAYFAPHQPHHPNIPHPDFVGRSTQLLGERSYLKGDGTTATQRVATSAYHDVVHELDFRIGLLLRKLDELGLAQNTIVIFTSDNGPWTNQPLAAKGRTGIIGTGYPYRGGKFEFWEGSTRVPALIRYPQEIPAGVISAAPVSGLDWLPTLVHRGGGTVPTDRKLDGFDLWSSLTGAPSATSPRPYVAYDRGKKIVAVSDGRFKQFENRLANLHDDLTESVAVPASAAPELAKFLAAANLSLAAELPGLEPASAQRIVVAPCTTRYIEVPDGGSATVALQLLVAPTTLLTLDLRPRAGSAALELSATSLTFTPSNWNQPQSITVKFSSPPFPAARYATCEVAGPASLPIREIYLRTSP